MYNQHQIEMASPTVPESPRGSATSASTTALAAGGRSEAGRGKASLTFSSGICNMIVIALHCVLSVILNFFPCLWSCCGLTQKLKSIITDDYGRAIARVRRLALINCGFVSLNHFLSFCVLTWASAIVLGGFIGSISSFYFQVASALLILQAVQFGTAATWRTFLPPRRLTSIRMSGNFAGIMDLQKGTNLMRIEIPCILLLILLSSGRAFRAPNLCGQHSESKVLFESLYVFSWLVASNGVIAAAGIFCGRLLFYYNISPCLGDYFDTIIRVSLENGLRGARKVELIDILFEMIGEEYRQTEVPVEEVLAQEVLDVYQHMIDYVYEHERGTFEATLKAMESVDRQVQQAAVYMVGFWADREAERLMEGSSSDDQRKRLLRFEGALIRKLIELATLASTGRTARAAVSSLHKLAKHDPHGVMVAQKDIVALLARQIVDVVDLGEHSRFTTKPRVCESLPVLIKTLVELLESLQQLHVPSPSATASAGSQQAEYHGFLTSEQRGQLEERLLCVFQCPHSSKRLQAVAGYALHKTLQSTSFSESILHRYLMASEAAPPVPEDILQDEHDKYFHYLMGLVPAQWDTHTSLRPFTPSSRGGDPENSVDRIFFFIKVTCLPIILELAGGFVVFWSLQRFTFDGLACKDD